jgi:hypothetical protein
MGGKSQVGRRFLAEMPGRRGRVAGDDSCSPMPVTGRDGCQGSGRGVLGLAGALDHGCLAGPLGPATHWRRIRRPEADRAAFHGDAHPRTRALEPRSALPLVAERRWSAVGPQSRRDMEASFVERISGASSRSPVERRALSRGSSPVAGGGVRRRHSHRRLSHPSQESGALLRAAPVEAGISLPVWATRGTLVG